MSTEHTLPEARAALLATIYKANYNRGIAYSVTPTLADQDMRASVDALHDGHYLVLDNRTESDDVVMLTCKGIDYVEATGLASPELIKTHQAVRQGLMSVQQRIREGDSHAEHHWEEEVRQHNYHSDLIHFATVIYVRERSKYCQ